MQSQNGQVPGLDQGPRPLPRDRKTGNLQPDGAERHKTGGTLPWADGLVKSAVRPAFRRQMSFDGGICRPHVHLMAILKIARMGHPVLSRPAVPVSDPTAPEVRRLLADMAETLADAGGVGLAAPQVHVSLRLVIYHVPAARNQGEAVPQRALINPVLEPVGDETAAAVEACLSLPGLSGTVPRWQRIRYAGLDGDGRPVDGEAEGFHARLLQHECDHLDGILYPMRMTDLSTFGFVAEKATTPPPAADDADGIDGPRLSRPA